MRIENAENCQGCYFLKEANIRPYCTRMGTDIEKINVCLTGRLMRIPENLDDWRSLIQKGRTEIEAVWNKFSTELQQPMVY